MKKLNISRLVTILLILSVALLVPFNASADNANKKGSLSISFMHENVPISNAEFSIYKVAEQRNSEYVLVGDFADYGVSLDNITDVNSLSNVISTLSAYIARDSVAPHASGKTGSSGKLYFGNLDKGLYIGIGESVKIGNTTYIPQAFMVAIPGGSGSAFTYDAVVEPKYDLYRDNVDPETVDRRVLKIWDDNNDKYGKRTDEITVQLLRDGEVYDEVVLNEKNNWRYSWDKLSAKYQWQVVEKVIPDGYTLAVSLQGITFTLTNTYEEPDEPTKPTEPNQPTDPTKPTEPTTPTDPTKPTEPTTPTDPTKPTEPTTSTDPTKPTDPNTPTDPSAPTDPTTPTNPNTPNKPNEPTTPNKPTLPQTGQLWWPVPVLLMAGLMVCFIGINLKKRSEDSNA